ncbi:MAG: preprotein translocase subunit SecG [Venatoribacter sp.]
MGYIESLESIIVVAHIILSLAIIGLILIQQGKGAEAGASFGGGASQTFFGSSGSSNFLSRSTAIMATLFFVTSLALAMYAKQHATGLSDIGVPSDDVIKAKMVEQDHPVVEEYAPSKEAPGLDASVTDQPTVDEAK